MENRLELNKKPVYELPNEVLVKSYTKNISAPDFEPDLCLNAWGRNSGKVYNKGATVSQIWIKTDNKELIEYIKNTNWKSKIPPVSDMYRLDIWKFKKIILEEFYGVKYGE